MKKIILALAMTGAFVSCKDNKDKTLGTETTTTEAQKPVVVKEVHYVNTPAATPAATQPPAKKGWSKTAKGTAIGAGSGALVGALVSKKKGKGAIIGGAVGAGAGYIIGRHKDKKDGRVQ